MSAKRGAAAGLGDRVEAVVIQADESSGSLLLGSKDGGRVHDSAEVERAYADRLPVDFPTAIQADLPLQSLTSMSNFDIIVNVRGAPRP